MSQSSTEFEHWLQHYKLAFNSYSLFKRSFSLKSGLALEFLAFHAKKFPNVLAI